MRPQQNRRMRGRNNNNGNNNNRRGPNPLSRNYESNGPDVKIRGNAQHIADKYAALARDAQASGDRVIAENYLQHAEHYTRIILAAQAQMPQTPPREETLEDENDDNTRIDHAGENDHNDSNAESSQSLDNSPQPKIEEVRAEVALSENDDIAEKREPVKRQRRAPRRKTSQLSENDHQEDEKIETVSQAEHNASEDISQSGDTLVEEEKKPRRRRVVKTKVQKAEEEV
ncbi:DUF4167 domain-containing protein [Bartonella tamiae]|uniref:DUF4167 domain-containing protein n=1 Tax=Bartonella tamiae Th239 TaxID=1094558 RepID=J1K2K4_9HYPH|nr:DUF4167 domain-containing protein [Bartonella tamiae]EJF91717.1 hypothetical protein ME5_00096 [Bartonella tamiae Th239]